MSLRINTNIQAVNALRNLTQTSDMLGRTIERLASGLRVNRAADDPAGLIISENMRAQIVSAPSRGCPPPPAISKSAW
jgi:flagellin